MTQSSVAVSVDGREWVLLNASPDLREQFARCDALAPTGVRSSPLRAVIVTSAEVDHVAGLLTLREKSPFALYATAQTHAVLNSNSIFNALDPAFVERAVMSLDQPFTPLSRLEFRAFAVPGKDALYLEGPSPNLAAMGEQTVGLRISADERVFYFIPGCAQLPDWLVKKLSDADIVFFDGTVWEDDDMARSGAGQKTGSRMGHLPIAGAEGSLARLSSLRARLVYTHINNTNPILSDGPIRERVIQAGWEIAFDGMEIEL
jgi:pyrroloquinoline quinone biosynthesis protein B